MSKNTQHDIEDILKAIDTFEFGLEKFSKDGIRKLKVLASEYKRIQKQRDNLRWCFLSKEPAPKEDLYDEEKEQEEVVVEKRKSIKRQM